jgi:hypothetical protein
LQSDFCHLSKNHQFHVGFSGGNPILVVWEYCFPRKPTRSSTPSVHKSNQTRFKPYP